MKKYFIDGVELKEGMKIQAKGVNKHILIHKNEYGLYIKGTVVLGLAYAPNIYLSHLKLTEFEIIK